MCFFSLAPCKEGHLRNWRKESLKKRASTASECTYYSCVHLKVPVLALVDMNSEPHRGWSRVEHQKRRLFASSVLLERRGGFVFPSQAVACNIRFCQPCWEQIKWKKLVHGSIFTPQLYYGLVLCAVQRSVVELITLEIGCSALTVF